MHRFAQFDSICYHSDELLLHSNYIGNETSGERRKVAYNHD